jgi:hypothetical protein
MKRVLGLLAATTLLTTGALALGGGSVGAAATSTPVVPIVQTIDLPETIVKQTALVYAVHGLNLDGQTAQTDGGTSVTVCDGATTVVPDFQFGDIAGPLEIPWGTAVDLKVFLGADADCNGSDAVITLATTIPEAQALTLIATAGPDGELQLLPVVTSVDADASCFPLTESAPAAQALTAVLGAVHAANAGPVVVEVNGNPAPGTLSFGEKLVAPVVPGTYSVAVTLDGTPIVGPVDLPLDNCTATFVYVVGNQPIAEEPTTTTTAPAPAAQAVAARPAFTG